MDGISIEIAIIFFALLVALMLFREYQNRRSMNRLRNESDELRNSIYSLQTEEKNFREKDFRKLLADFNRLKDKLDEYENENVKLKKLLEKKK
jgi:signal transduction histidine kinase